MNSNIPASVRNQMIDTAKLAGYLPELKADGTDRYDKLMTFIHGDLPAPVYVDKSIGISKNGVIRYFKVVVHPKTYQADLENTANGIEPAINVKTKRNSHCHSAYQGYPSKEGNNEPVGMAYRVKDMEAMEVLLQGITDPGRSYL